MPGKSGKHSEFEKLEDLRNKLKSTKDENEKLQQKIEELVSTNMEYYQKDHTRRSGDFLLFEYQRLIFGELKRYNETQSEVLKLIEPRNSKEVNALEIAKAELAQMNIDRNEDLVENNQNNENNIVEVVEKQMEEIIKILKLNHENEEISAEMKSQIQVLICGLEDVLNPGQLKRLNTTVEMNSEDEEIQDKLEKELQSANTLIKSLEENLEGLKISAEEDEKVVNKKISSLKEIIKEKDLIIKDLHSMTCTLNEKLNGMEKNASKVETSDGKLREELENFVGKEESLKSQVEVLLKQEKELTATLDNVMKQNDEMLEESQKVQNQMKAELKESETKKNILEVKVAKLLGEIDRLAKAHNKMESQKAEVEAEIYTLNCNLAKSENEKKKYQDKIYEMETKLKDLAFISTKTAELKEMHAKCDDKIKKLEAEIKSLNKAQKNKKKEAMVFPSTNPFAEDIQDSSPQKPKVCLIYRDPNENSDSNALKQELLSKDEEIQCLQKLINELRLKTPRHGNTSSSS